MLDAAAFHNLMDRIDKALAEKGIPAAFRVFYAYGEMRGPGSHEMGLEIDPTCGPYEGTNLLLTVEDWYRKHYPPKSIHVEPFGERPILVRGETFMLKLPARFNVDPATLAAANHIQGCPESLLGILDENEKCDLQKRFNLYFQQTARLALLEVRIDEIRNGPNAKFVRELILSGCSELRSAGVSIGRIEGAAYMWAIQQAVEKFYKAYLGFADSSMSAKNMKQRFGHNLLKLVLEVCKHEEAFRQILPHIDIVDVSPDMRYKPATLTRVQAIQRIDVAYSMCDLVVRVLLRKLSHGC